MGLGWTFIEILLHSGGSHHFDLCWGCSPVLHRCRTVMPFNGGNTEAQEGPSRGGFLEVWLSWAQNSELSGLLDPGAGIGGCWDRNNQDGGG